MLKLRDGGLYETRDGRRYRVMYDAGRGVFVCPRSFSYSWYDDGSCNTLLVTDYLVREIEEKRWVPVCGQDTAFEQMQEHGIYRMRRGHIQQLVTRAEAQARQPQQVAAIAVTPNRIQDAFGGWVDCVLRRENDVSYVDFHTSRGARITLSL